jgi:hypothetical protein
MTTPRVSRWSPPTLRSHLAATRATARPPAGIEDDDNPLVRCGCGRRTNADMLTDLRPLPDAMRSALGFADADFICDACRERALFLEARMDPAQFLLALGAPLEVIERAAARRGRMQRRDDRSPVPQPST